VRQTVRPEKRISRQQKKGTCGGGGGGGDGSFFTKFDIEIKYYQLEFELRANQSRVF
jgi:hypothetical protein